MERNYFLKEVSKFDYIDDSHVIKFPTEVFPEQIQYIIDKLDKISQFEKQVVGASILFSVSTVIGNSRKIIVKESWKDTPNLWIAIVGKRGTMKSPTISYCLKPLLNEEKQFNIDFQRDIANWLQIPKKIRKDEDRPVRRQRFTNDTTVEGLIDAMVNNYNGIGIYKDELNGFFEELNRYKSGGNLEFYLSAFNGGTYIKNRKSYDPQTVNDIYLSMLGSIQPEVLKTLAATQTHNGMVDRWLYVLSDDRIQNSTMEDIPTDITTNYYLYISNIINQCSNHSNTTWLPGANEAFVDVLNELEDIMRDEQTDPAMFTYISKLKTYFARLCVIIATMEYTNYIGIPEVNKAKKLLLYFYLTAQKTFIGFQNQITAEKIFSIERATTPKEKIFAVVKHLPDLNNSQIAKFTNISRPTVVKYVKECKVGVKGDLVENETVK